MWNVSVALQQIFSCLNINSCINHQVANAVWCDSHLMLFIQIIIFVLNSKNLYMWREHHIKLISLFKLFS